MKTKLIICTLFINILLSLSLVAEKASVVSIKGEAYKIHRFKKSGLKKGMELDAKTMIVTKKDTKVEIALPDKSIVTVSGDSRVKLTNFLKKDNARNTEIEVINGLGSFNVKKLKKKDSFVVKTPTSVAGVRGTKFLVRHKRSRRRGKSSIAVISGRVSVASVKFAGKRVSRPVMVQAMQVTQVEQDSAPSKPAAITQNQMKAIEASLTNSSVLDTIEDTAVKIETIMENLAETKVETAQEEQVQEDKANLTDRVIKRSTIHTRPLAPPTNK